MINLTEKDNCLRRAIFTGLRYSGITDDDCSWVPIKPGFKQLIRVLRKLVKKYPKLKFHEGQYSYIGHNYPVVIIYGTGEIADGKQQSHAMFCSDQGYIKEAEMIIYGWEEYLP